MRHLTLAGALAAVTVLLLLAGSSPAQAFSPTYSMTIGDNAGPNEFLVVPSTDDCTTNTAAFPGGIACEMFQTTSIPAGDPTARFDTAIPKPKFTIASGLPALGGVSNGTQVGALGFTIGVDLTPCLPNFLNVPYPGVTLIDAALPDYSIGPWAGSSNGMPLEGPNSSGAAAVFSPVVWPVDLESDPNANSYHAAGAPLIARYFAVAPTGGPGTPINVLVFDVGTAYRTTIVTGDPALPPASVTYCTPATTTVDFLGSTTDVGTSLPAQLRQCNVVGADLVSATFTPTVGAPVTVTDPISCPLAPTVSGLTGNYCIVGNSTGIGWSWRIDSTTSSGNISYPGTASPPSGPLASDLATKWADSITTAGHSGVSSNPTGDCFAVNLAAGTGSTGFDLYVKTGSAPECKITASGCSFNPIVYLMPPVGGAVSLAVSDTGSPLPVMPLAASVAALAAAVAICGWYARRRWQS